MKALAPSARPVTLAGLATLRDRLGRDLAPRLHAAFARAFQREPQALWPQDRDRSAPRSAEATSPPNRRGEIALVGAGPGARDLLTLRAVERIQAADVVFYDRLVDDDVLDLAPPGAEKVFVGKHVGAHAWPQARINRVIVAEALRGRRVVRLKSGDPGIFGRAGEEIDAARAAGIAIELVPGVTAVSAAGAALGRSLTERGVSNTLVLATGTGSAEDPLPDCTRLAGPGTTTAFYMAARQADRIARALMARGVPPDARIDVVVDASKPGQRQFSAPVARLAAMMACQSVTGCAILLLTWPEARAPLPSDLPMERHPALMEA